MILPIASALTALCLGLQARADLNLANGYISFNTSAFRVQLVKDSQTAYMISPLTGSSTSINYIPADKMSARVANGRYHFGDITFRARVQGSSSWTNGNSATTRAAVTTLTPSGSILASADLTPTLGSAGNLLKVVRNWVSNGTQLHLQFVITNPGSSPVEIGALGAPLEFNNIFSDRTAADTNTKCSLIDPYIGADAGFVQVTPLLGTMQPLVVLPGASSPLEGWRFLSESTSGAPYYQSQTFEGIHEWMFHTSAYASSEWASVSPWNAATNTVLAAGASRTYTLRLSLAASIRTIDAAVTAAGQPLANAIPGYILSRDGPGKLFLKHTSAVSSITVSPSGALTLARGSDTLSSGWISYDVTPSSSAFGRTRVSIVYADGKLQTVHYFVTKGATQRIADMGSFLTNQQWYTNTSDPFKRAPSVISYDRETNRQVLDEQRAWIAGLSDEAGAGAFLAAAMKQFLQPTAAEVTKMEQFINGVVWGQLQNTDYTVKKSLYFYDKTALPSYPYPTNINYGNWWSWNRASAYAIDRAYDYVHVVATYWALYRVARNYPSLVTTRTWQWYLNQAVATIIRMGNGGVGYTDVGLMGETVYWLTLTDAKREGLSSNVTALETAMRRRQSIWAGQRYPFGSEMAWDSTGQEGVYIWSKYFNDSNTATNTINSIIAFQPTVPHWGYDGNARRYWDNIYGGKLQRIERQLHHYGSGLNALPLIYEFETKPTDLYLLRVGYAGLLGSQSNIDSEGFASAAFHSFPDTLKWDGYSGDYGPNFSGHAMGIGAFLLQHPDFGWQIYGGRVTSSSSTIDATVLDDGRRRVYIAPLGTLFTLDAGAFNTLSYNPSTRAITFGITSKPSTPSTAAAAPQGRIVVNQMASVSGVGTVRPSTTLSTVAGAYTVPFDSSGAASVTFTSA